MATTIVRQPVPLARVLAAAASLLLPGLTQAEGKVFGDWSVGVTDSKDWIYAVTVNDSKAVFGERCSIKDGRCHWIIALDIGCESSDGKSKQPILVNSEGGAAYLELVCEGETSNGVHRYLFTSWKDIETLIDEGARIGFALPLKSGQFEVVRFSLNGMKQARELVEEATEKVSKTSTRNQTL